MFEKFVDLQINGIWIVFDKTFTIKLEKHIDSRVEVTTLKKSKGSAGCSEDFGLAIETTYS